jgi:hypothetical protein
MTPARRAEIVARLDKLAYTRAEPRGGNNQPFYDAQLSFDSHAPMDIADLLAENAELTVLRPGDDHYQSRALMAEGREQYYIDRAHKAEAEVERLTQRWSDLLHDVRDAASEEPLTDFATVLEWMDRLGPNGRSHDVDHDPGVFNPSSGW